VGSAERANHHRPRWTSQASSLPCPYPPPAPPLQGGEFSAAAVRLAGFAGALLGWSPDAFWSATPAELAAVVAVLTGGEAAVPPDADTIARLKEAHPDG